MSAEGFFFPGQAQETDESLLLDIDGWEGPLDLLLALARNQKVDLREISILELVQRSEERRVGKECRSRGSPYH